ncbi:fibronectin type III [Flammeovirgaceae bacterium 311]|nr:fibronectin type III [Flammeovirgaceae bacterium 311]
MYKSLLLSIIILNIVALAPPGIAFAQVQNIEIDVEERYQTIEGFGTCVIDFLSSPEMPGYFDDSLYNMAVNDLGMSMLRLSFPQSMEWKNDDGDPDHFNWPAFSMEQLHKRMQVAQEFQKRGVDKVLVSTWSPPEFTKTHRSTIFGGHLRMDMYEEYAENFAALVIAAKKNWGINIGAVGLQNELLFIEPYKSCIYNPYQAREAVRVLQRKFQKEGIQAKIIMPEEMMALHRMKAYVGPVMADQETSRFRGALAAHRLEDGEKLSEWKEFSAPFNKQSWMTETSGHSTDWQGALELAEDIHEHLVLGNFSAWIYWQLSENKDDVYSLMNKHTPLPKYHTSKHFYRYIRPGARRVQASTSGQVLASAFVHPVSGQLTVVLVNKHTEAANIRLALRNFKMKDFSGYLSTEGAYFAAIKKYRSGKSLQMPANAVITLIAQDKGLATEQEVEPWPEAWIPSDGDPLSYYGTMEGTPPSKADHASLLARVGNLEKLTEALKGISVNDTVYNGWTPLHFAALAGQAEIMKYLISQGADVNQPAAGGWSPFHMAASAFGGNGHDGQKVTKDRILQIALEAKPDVQQRTNDGWTALHAAVINSHTAWSQDESEVIRRVDALIHAGIDVNVTDKEGRSPLHWAAWQGYESMVQVRPAVVNELIKRGAEVNMQDSQGNTPLHYAVLMGYPSIIEALLDAGAAPELKNHKNESPLFLAEKAAYWNVWQLLQGQRTGVNARVDAEQEPKSDGKLGRALLQAAWKGEEQEVKRLLDAGADVFFRDSDGFRAIDRARDGGHTEIVRLIQHKIDELKQ